MYAFGLAIHFEHKSEAESVESVLKEKLHWNCMTVQEPVQFIVVYMNSHLETFLKSHDLDCVPLLAEVPFQEVLFPDTFFGHLGNRGYEDFVLSVPKKLLKWKAFGERTSQRSRDKNNPIRWLSLVKAKVIVLCQIVDS
jgi:hypothetical protein